jgi:hypothetical protein
MGEVISHALVTGRVTKQVLNLNVEVETDVCFVSNFFRVQENR